jgi:hypothetical protein
VEVMVRLAQANQKAITRVTLEDGRRVILHEARGFTIGWSSGDSWGNETLENMTRSVLTVVLPDDDECGESTLVVAGRPGSGSRSGRDCGRPARSSV